MKYLSEFDRRLTVAVARVPVGWRPLMLSATLLGEPLVILAVGLSGFLIATDQNKPAASRAFAYALVAFCLGTLLKHWVHRARPNHLSIANFGIKSYSFPSGHAFGSLIFYGLLAVIFSRHLAMPWSFLAILIIWSTIFLIGVSRVYLKSHYPSDVIGGWLFGGVALIFIVNTTF